MKKQQQHRQSSSSNSPQQPYVWSQVVQNNNTQSTNNRGQSNNGSRPRQQQQQQQHQRTKQQRNPPQQQQQTQQQTQHQHEQQQMHHTQENHNGHRMNQPILWSPQPYPMPHHPQRRQVPNNSVPVTPHGQPQQQQQEQQQYNHEESPLNTLKYSYEWDPQNAQRFLSARAAMLHAIFSSANNNNNTGSSTNNHNNVNNHISNNHGDGIPSSMNYQRSHSDQLPTTPPLGFTSPTRPHDSKHYSRAVSVDALSSQNQPPPPPSLPHLNTPGKQYQQSKQRKQQSSKQQQKKQQQQRSRTLPQSKQPPKMPSPSSSNNLNNTKPSTDNSNAATNTNAAMDTLNEVLPIPQTYFSYAIRYLLMDTPLPLVGGQSNSKIQPRPPHLDETIFLLPRYWMGKWLHWARNKNIIHGIECWFAHWERYDAQSQGQQSSSPQQREKRTFSLMPEFLKGLSALSILSDQYQLHANTDEDWIEWIRGLEHCWNQWNEQQQQFHHKQRQHGKKQQRSSMDEKKHEEDLHHNHQNSNSPHQQSPADQQQLPPYPQYAFPYFSPPGPVDNRILSTRHRPLLMHPHISLSMGGLDNGTNDNDNNESNDNSEVLTPTEEMDEANLTQFIDSLWIPNDKYATATHVPKKLAVCPVPTQFYEMLRSTHGVHCDDGDLSFDAGLRGGVDAGKGDNSHSSSLLFHDQWEVDDDGNVVPGNNDDDKVNYRGYHPYYYENDLATGAAGGGSANSNQSSSSQQPSFEHPTVRPIEFRRRILSVPIFKNDEGEGSGMNGGAQPKVTSPYSKLMQEAMKSQNEQGEGQGGQNGGNNISRNSATLKKNGTKGNAAGLTVDTSAGINNDGAATAANENMGYMVELFPIEFRYTIVDGAAPPTNDNGNNSRKGIALVSRASLAANVLHDLERAATPKRATACTRLWKRSPTFTTTNDAKGRVATLGGDGFDLLDINELAPPPSTEEIKAPPPPPPPLSYSKMASAAPSSSKSKQDPTPPPLTIEKWLGLQELSIVQNSNQLQSSGPVVVELLIEIRTSPTSGWEREPLELGNRLQVGDYVDAQDSARKWYEGIVREVTPETVKVHYFGWGSRWDTHLPRMKGTNSKALPPVPLWTKTAKWREQIKVGDEVEIRESTSMVQRPKWHRGTVLAVGNETDPPRKPEGGAKLELLDENDAGKKIPLMLLKRRRQILVEVPQEIHNCSTTPLTPPPRNSTNNDDNSIIPDAAHPPFRRWVSLYGEEICKVNTHKTAKKITNSPVTLNYTMESQRPPVEVMKPFNNIHGSGFVRESLRGIPPAAGTVGLHNLGNSCYMNSILQCINHIKPITQYFLKGDYLKEMNKKNPLGSGGRMATAYASFLNDIWTGEFSILAPRLLKQTVGCFAPQFNNTIQHDSQEFCQYLMDGLHEDLNRVKSKPYVEQMEANGMDDGRAAMESWRKHLLRHDSIFVDYTQGMHRSHLTCPSCGRESIKFDIYSSISLPIVPAKNRSSIPLKDCLDQFAAGEQLDSHNAWYCSSCKKHVCALKLITLWNTPDVLVLHLKRFTFEKCPTVDGRLIRRKIDETVDFPIDRLDMSPYTLGPTDPDAPPIYKLFGVSEHTGSTANSGHYTATVRNTEDGNWYRYNDSHVGTSSGEAAVTGGAYLLFYQRAKGSLRWAGMEKEMIAERSKNDSSNMAAGEDTDGFREVTGKKKKKR